MMGLVAECAESRVLTGKGDRDWIAGNNAKIRASASACTPRDS